MQKCELTGKGKQYGSNVSFLNATPANKVWKPNLQTKTWRMMAKAMKLSTQAIRNPQEKGLALISVNTSATK